MRRPSPTRWDDGCYRATRAMHRSIRGYLMPAPADGFRDSERPWMTGHPDGFCDLDGSLGVLEVKTAGEWQRSKWGEAIPLQYVAQTQHYLHLTGCDVALVAVLIGGQRFEVKTVRRDERAIGFMLDLEQTFWGYVERDQPPPPDGSDSAREALLALYPQFVLKRSEVAVKSSTATEVTIFGR